MTHIGFGWQARRCHSRCVAKRCSSRSHRTNSKSSVFTEVQILKGSCPFLATSNKDGSWEFVTDLLWRSPLGLKINAQTVPPIAATQDWVKVHGNQLTARSGVYELAITAQLMGNTFH